MSTTTASPAAPAMDAPSPPDASSRFLPVLLLLFVGSGCAALVYEIVWFQLLQLVIGSTAVSLGVLLGSFMGGMCLGSLLLPRLISPRWHPLGVYAVLEVGIAATGVALLFGIPWISQLYIAYAGHGLPAILLRGLVCAVCLLPPTLLMGATLPAIARWLETTPRGIAWMGFFYGGNIAGAVFGCLLAGFYLLRVHDVAVATSVAAALNVAVALIALLVMWRAAYRPVVDVSSPDVARRAAAAWTVYVAIGLSGFTALAAQVVWTRQLSLLLGATVYTFSIILAVFLVGLGIGSSVGSALARTARSPRLLLGGCQALLAVGIFYTAYMISASVPYWPIDPSLAFSPWHTFQLDILRSLWVMLPAAVLWGASFPLALAAIARPGQDAGRLVGEVYAANTLGAILGAAVASMLLVAWLGTRQTQQLLIGLATISAALVLAPMVFRRAARALSEGLLPTPFSRWTAAAVLLSAVCLAGLLPWQVPSVPAGLIAYGRYLPSYGHDLDVLYLGEGMNASIAVTENYGGTRSFHVSGKIVASTLPQDMRLQRMLGHLSALLHDEPRSVLVVGCGAGVTAGSFVVHPEVERIVICEIEPLIPPAAGEFFGPETFEVMSDPRVELVYDDARHFILNTRETFDVITSDPIHPWVKGAASLYSREYFEACRDRLNPGGLITQWVPLYETSLEAVKSEIATFMEVFPHGTIWANDDEGRGYDIVLLAQVEPTQIDLNQLERRLTRPDHDRVLASLWEVGFASHLDLLAKYAGQGPDLHDWLAGAEINRDRTLRLQYLAGMGLNLYLGDFIFHDLLLHRRFPEQLFVASDDQREQLRRLIDDAFSGN